MSASVEDLRAILERLESATGPDRELDHAIMQVLIRHWLLTWKPETSVADDEVTTLMLLRSDSGSEFSITTRLDAATTLVEIAVPGFWQSSGLCSLTGHASIGPDYNGPDGDRLRLEWPEEAFHEGFHADLKPGDGRHRQCFALIHCALQALIAKSEAYERECVRVEERMAARRALIARPEPEPRP